MLVFVCIGQSISGKEKKALMLLKVLRFYLQYCLRCFKE